MERCLVLTDSQGATKTENILRVQYRLTCITICKLVRYLALVHLSIFQIILPIPFSYFKITAEQKEKNQPQAQCISFLVITFVSRYIRFAKYQYHCNRDGESPPTQFLFSAKQNQKRSIFFSFLVNESVLAKEIDIQVFITTSVFVLASAVSNSGCKYTNEPLYLFYLSILVHYILQSIYLCAS